MFLDMQSAFKTLSPVMLGSPGRDNALYVRVSAGQSMSRVLFDCGADCLSGLSIAEVSKIDLVFFSHLHFDHVAGFDHFLRCNFDRESKPIRIFGPPRTAEILHHRLQGVLWDRVEGTRGEFSVTEIDGVTCKAFTMRSTDGFKHCHASGERPYSRIAFESDEFLVAAIVLDHGSPSLGYHLATKPSVVIDTEQLKALGYPPGPWLQQIKDLSISADTPITVDGVVQIVGELRRVLIKTKPGESIGYLTDFCSTPNSVVEIAAMLHGCTILVCENNYRDQDSELATKNYHVTSTEVGQIAAAANAGKLVVFHLSDRYATGEWLEQLGDVQKSFSAAYFPAEWQRAFAADAPVPS
jgi:ribonuclease Z